MKFNYKLGIQLLSIWLIVTGLRQVISIPIPAIAMIMPIIAIAAGVLILLDK